MTMEEATITKLKSQGTYNIGLYKISTPSHECDILGKVMKCSNLSIFDIVAKTKCYDAYIYSYWRISTEIYFNMFFSSMSDSPYSLFVNFYGSMYDDENENKYDIFKPSDDKITLLFSYIPKTLHEVLRNGYDNEKIKSIIFQIIIGMYIMKLNNVIHGDLTPNNILIEILPEFIELTYCFNNKQYKFFTNVCVKIIDFGLSFSDIISNEYSRNVLHISISDICYYDCHTFLNLIYSHYNLGNELKSFISDILGKDNVGKFKLNKDSRLDTNIYNYSFDYELILQHSYFIQSEHDENCKKYVCTFNFNHKYDKFINQILKICLECEKLIMLVDENDYECLNNKKDLSSNCLLTKTRKIMGLQYEKSIYEGFISYKNEFINYLTLIDEVYDEV